MNNDFIRDASLIILGWFLGTASSFISFWLEGKRDKSKARLEDIRNTRNWDEKASLRGYDLEGANLSGKKLAHADLEEANFTKAKMWETVLTHANLIRAKFNGAKLVGVDLRTTNLTLADFTKAELIQVDFSNANLHRTKLRNIRKVERCNWLGVKIDDTTELTLELRKEIEKQNESIKSTSTTSSI